MFECVLLQNHVTELMNFHLAGLERMREHCNRLIQTVKEFSPVLVYLSQSDVRETIVRAAQERVFADGSWIDGIIRYSENTPYGKLNGRKGLDGVILGFEKRKQELERTFQQRWYQSAGEVR